MAPQMRWPQSTLSRKSYYLILYSFEMRCQLVGESDFTYGIKSRVVGHEFLGWLHGVDSNIIYPLVVSSAYCNFLCAISGLPKVWDHSSQDSAAPPCTVVSLSSHRLPSAALHRLPYHARRSLCSRKRAWTFQKIQRNRAVAASLEVITATTGPRIRLRV